MKNYSIKFRRTVPYFFLISFATTAVVLAFRWIFTINSEIFPVKESIFHIWLPLILPFFPLAIWLRPKLRILKFKAEGSNAPMLFQVIAYGTMIAMLIISNSYLKTATGSLTQLHTIDDFTPDKSLYISLDSLALNRDFGSAHSGFEVSGKRNQYLNVRNYFVYPLKSRNTFKYWVGLKFKDEIDNEASPEEKKRLFQELFSSDVQKFESFNFDEPNYFEVLRHSKSREGYLSAIRRLEIETSEPVVITPQEGLFEERNGKKLAWIFGSFGIGLCLFMFVLIFPKYDEEEHVRQKKGIKPKSDGLVDMIQYLVPKGDHFSTSIILDINILVFLIMVFSGVHLISPSAIDLLSWGGNRQPETTSGEWWRLVFSMFVHGGIMHLFLNIYGLVIAAIFVEPIFKRVKYFLLYFISGICGSLASIFWYENTVSVGASGAIFGLYGAILGLLLTSAYPPNEKKGILLFVGPYIGINLLYGMLGGIDNAAHIGGLVSGAIFGVILFTLNKKEAS